ncbi:MAG TPA: hypothetical protein PLJ26_06095, partial [Candidatus Omnitrophota bacterium]|nr:hypothetical protein [Candidatus Omnitrophota bacterium]
RPTEITLTQSEIVQSTPVIERVVRRLALDKLPLDHEKKYASALKDIVIDIKNAKTFRKISKMEPDERDTFLFNKAVRDLKKRIKVEPVRDTDLFLITASAFNAKDAARIANVVSRSYCIFDLEQQLAELKQQYGEKHLSVVQLQNNIDKLAENLTGESLPNIEAIGPASVKIIEQAVEPAEAAGKPRALIFVMSFIVSIIFGTVLAFTFDYFDSTLKSPKEIAANLPMPYLGYVPHVRSMAGNSVALVRRGVNTAAVLSCAAILVYTVLIMLGVDSANPIFVSTSVVASPVASLTGRVPFGRLLAPMALFTAIVIATAIASNLIARLEKRAFKSGTRIKDFTRNSSYIRAYRSLAQMICLPHKSGEHRSVLFVSALPREGVSTVVANLAGYLASSGQKVLVIDGNRRDPGMHRLFRLDNAQGLSDVLSGNVGLQDAVQKAGDGLFVLCAGASCGSPDLPDPAPFSKLIEEAKQKYQMVLIDSPNLKDHSDAVSLCPYVSGVVLVVSEGKPRREVLRASLAGLEQKKAVFFGVILNNRTFAIPSAIYERA